MWILAVLRRTILNTRAAPGVTRRFKVAGSFSGVSSSVSSEAVTEGYAEMVTLRWRRNVAEIRHNLRGVADYTANPPRICGRKIHFLGKPSMQRWPNEMP